jgi:uncharacterized membrane protein YdjX (TVP38/TMEM64 family)
MLPPPFPTSPFLVSAGALNYSLRNYMIAVSIGRTLRYAVIAGVGALYGSALLQYFHAHRRALFIMMTTLAVGGGIAIGLYMWKQHQTRKQPHPRTAPEPKVA